MATEAKQREVSVIHVPASAEAERGWAGKNPAGVWLSGNLKKKGHGGFGMKQWKEYFFVLYREKRELRYYKRAVRAKWGHSSVSVPIEEHGVFPMDCIVDIRDVHKGKFGGTRFDLIIRSMGDSHYPGEFNEQFEKPWFQFKERVFRLLAPDASSKELWLDTLRAMKHGAGRLEGISELVSPKLQGLHTGTFPDDHTSTEPHGHATATM